MHRKKYSSNTLLLHEALPVHFHEGAHLLKDPRWLVVARRHRGERRPETAHHYDNRQNHWWWWWSCHLSHIRNGYDSWRPNKSERSAVTRKCESAMLNQVFTDVFLWSNLADREVHKRRVASLSVNCFAGIATTPLYYSEQFPASVCV